MKFELNRDQAIKLILDCTDKDDPYWENLVADFYDEETDSMPTIYDVLGALGVSEEDIDRVENIHTPILEL